jgi:hypothetical protein
MSSIKLFTVAAILAAIALANQAAHRPEAEAARDAFKGYKQALINHDGEAAAAFVSKGTVDYYGKIKELALRGERQTVAGLPILDKMTVLMLRLTYRADTLENMTATSLFASAVEKELFNMDTVVSSEVGKVKVSGERASITLINRGVENQAFLPLFVKEGRSWKLDSTALFGILGWALEKSAKDSGLSEDEFLVEILSKTTGKEVTNTIWEPLHPAQK